ncbi:MAG: chaperonin GroES [Thermoproteota archaeon]
MAEYTQEDAQMAKTYKVRPLHDRILVKRMDEEKTTAGGIIIPDSAKEKPQKGEIVAAGNGKTTEEGKKVALEVKVGDEVLFGKYSGTELKLDGEELLMMREEDILGVLSK